MAIFRGSFLQKAPERKSNVTLHITEIVRALNRVVEFIVPKGFLGEEIRGTIALNANLSSTAVFHPRITVNSVFLWTARSQSAATSPTFVWAVPSAGRVIINHDVSAITTRLIRYIVV